MLLQTEELTRLYQERLVHEAQSARLASASAASGPGMAQPAINHVGESFISLGLWMKKVSQSESIGEQSRISFNT